QVVIPSRPGFTVAGREHHLAALQRDIDSMLSGVPKIRLVSGDVGIGKTALIEEACRYAIAQDDRVVVLWSECPGGQGSVDQHQPLRHVLRLMSGDTDVASP